MMKLGVKCSEFGIKIGTKNYHIGKAMRVEDVARRCSILETC